MQDKAILFHENDYVLLFKLPLKSKKIHCFIEYRDE